ncbi:hypothetical protein [Sinisalibacter lacisalsi]|uniref:DUF4412 domain-containing protein n=1 Tax=Sinisalibacter lacisalsi TaxID=1526570 RepID=A0ABQ1QS73_9RHOB|nr:hypothetical protein [Sinisalibacter lacisalsi]GGD43504.1 hypothetical protein GCM10011358_29160 [Sinisalibacter lacisalsi]
MSIFPLRALGALVLSLGLTGAALAQASEPPAYTARAVHRLPDGSVDTGAVVKSGPDMRLEYTENGRDVVQIIRRAEGVMYLLDPAKQTYFEMRGAPAPDPTGAGYMPPCQEGDPGLSCTFKGTEVISGITAEIWEIGMPGQPGVSTVLWDGARHRALRQTGPDGSVMRMAFLSMVEVAGRRVEHWSMSFEAPGQPAQSGAWFYDPELRVEIREEMITGAVRELEDIRVGPVDPALFEVPAGWTKLDGPAGPVPGQGN